MPAASFVHSGGSITFTRSPQRPDRALDIVQPRRQSAARVRFGFAHTITSDLIPLRLRLTSAEKADFLTFFTSTVNGMAEPFTYTDTAGVAATVHFNRPQLGTVLEKAHDSWEIDVELRVAA